MVLKNNAGTDDNRVRKLDYSIQFCKLFYDRLIANEDITLFSPHEAKGLYEAFGDNEKFEELYLKYENKRSLKFKRKIPARQLAQIFARERLETGRIYSMNIDNANEHGSWSVPCYMSNLCVTGDSSVMVDVEGQLCTISIKEVVDLVQAGKTVKVLSSKDGVDSFELITDAALISESADILEISDLESGFTVKCTPDHKVYTKNRGYVMAKDLEESDELQVLE
jgi:ribonucleotide reductase alpha subunit